MKIRRRDMFRTAAAAAAAAGLAPSPMARAAATPGAPDVYTRVGVRPFINLTATLTINGGTLTLPEVKRAMDEASYHSVNLDELMEKVGARIAELLGAEAAIVTSGAAAAASHAVSAAITGGDPELMSQLPDLTGLRDEVVMARASRNQYDHAIRAVGVRIVEFNTRQEFLAALSRRTALVAVLGTGEAQCEVRLEEISEEARKRSIPVLVDAAAELPLRPNPYLSRGATLVAYSGGKIIRGPQCAGLLLGRKDLIRAAWVNSAPHHAFGRMMKVGKEETMGMLAAIEAWVGQRDIQKEYKLWESWLSEISDGITKVQGVRTKIVPPAGASPFPVMQVEWDPERIGLTAGEVNEQLLKGEPRIMSQASGRGHSFVIRPVSIKQGDHLLVRDRLRAVFAGAPAGGKKQTPAAPSEDLSGRWEATLEFPASTARHVLFLQARGNEVKGLHTGRKLRGDLVGMVDGADVRLTSRMPVEGNTLSYDFRGKLQGGKIEGEVELGEYGRARFTARRT
jgi:uncharacterized pyridoxal phosphate-dependent enzyme